jgi:hypothetical protein
MNANLSVTLKYASKQINVQIQSHSAKRDHVEIIGRQIIEKHEPKWERLTNTLVDKNATYMEGRTHLEHISVAQEHGILESIPSDLLH